MNNHVDNFSAFLTLRISCNFMKKGRRGCDLHIVSNYIRQLQQRPAAMNCFLPYSVWQNNSLHRQCRIHSSTQKTDLQSVNVC